MIFAWVAIAMLPGMAWAQSPDEPQERVFVASEASPEERLDKARESFHDGDFARIRPLLEKILVPTSRLANPDERREARQLLGVGAFFEAQQVTDATRRRELLDLARSQFLEMLREEPDFSMDPLLYPASVVELFEDVLRENADELEALRAEQNTDGEGFSVDTLYVERTVDENTFALTFFPFGIGQFQNGDEVKGTLFAVAQGLSLAINITSYLAIENLRDSDGFYDTGVDGRSGAFSDAIAWRRALYGSLIAFGVAYAGSVVDGILHYKPQNVTIRALDAPPPELGGEPSGTGLDLPLGWSIEWTW